MMVVPSGKGKAFGEPFFLNRIKFAFIPPPTEKTKQPIKKIYYTTKMSLTTEKSCDKDIDKGRPTY
jgi:hypothetical protein